MNPPKILALATALLGFNLVAAHAQAPGSPWHNKPCAVVLTYDDAIDIDLDNVIPALDSAKFRGTFYLIGSSPVVTKRLGEWRRAAQRGHELGNHTLFHPCDGRPPGRTWVNPDHDLSKYTVGRAVDEIRANNVLLNAIDGKTARTFAYPCGDLLIDGVNYYDQVKNDFVAARGVAPGLLTPAQTKLDNIDCYSINGQSGDYLVDLVKQAQAAHRLVVFLFHGVGGGHAINVGLPAHRQLLRYPKAHEKEIWVAPLVEVAGKIKDEQQQGAAKK
jgi:sialate O-acetylesterase